MENTVFIHTYKGASTAGDIFVWQKPVDTNSFSLKISELLIKAAKTTAVIGTILLFISFAPSIWHATKTQGVAFASKIFAKTEANEVNGLMNTVSNIGYQPRFDASLPLENTIRISSIGVNSEIQESTLEYYEKALKKGIWRVSDFGTPYTRNKPTIMAAHRFGYLAWNNIFRRENSFFNLPKLKEGDIVEIIWRQRKYVYEVYATEEAEEISDYSADLILYTCETLSSPIRIYKYARLLEI
ncbi:sortase [Patescibacteria group bacterium]|nr:sortase [Patescibacteria group bacterium]MBU0777327.1 sortase [Patescibacteria group bacterium]MBU0846093.1 sortase [Patescibacteria group bacterium]MBU0923146.1 sortase [Patescibacteria group bacterium]MBU1066861.1 sortase [Patescibacteria group bacterium]